MTEEKAEKKFPKRTPTAQKRLVQNHIKQKINKSFKTRIRTARNAFEKAATEDKQSALNTLYSLYDRALKRGIYKLGKVSRMKSRYTSKVS